MKALLIACDFDGTVTQRDTLHVIVEDFGDRAVWDLLGPHLHSGAMTVEDALTRQFETVNARPEDVRDAVRRRAPVRDGFVEFVEWTRRMGHELIISSNGFRSVIEPVLADIGMADLEVIANDAHFTPRGTTIVWDERGDRCGRCDRPCKRAPIRDRLRDRRLVLVGDGISDRCLAGMADIVFARDFLARDLAERGRPFIPFDDFHQVRVGLEAAEVAA